MRSLQTVTDRGLRRYSPPPRALARFVASVRSMPSPCHPFARPPPSFAHSAGRTLVRSSAHSNIRPSAHRSFARTLALSYVARVVRSPLARFSCSVSFLLSLARSLGISAFARSLARSLVRSLVRSFVVVSFVHVWLGSFTHSLARFSCLCFLHFFARSLLQGHARQTARSAEGDGPRPAPVFAAPRALASSGRFVPSFITRAFIYHSFISIAVWKARPPRQGCLAGRRVLSCRRLPGPPARPERPTRRRAEGRW